MDLGKPIVLVGSERSGTSWIGDVLSSSPKIHLVYEPFNPYMQDMLFGRDWTWPNFTMPYLPEDFDGRRYVAPVRRLLRNSAPVSYFGRPFIGSVLGRRRTLRDWARPLAERLRAKGRRTRVLVKDPWATHLVPWLVTHFDVHIVHVVRHPCGVAAAQKRLNWQFDLSRVSTSPGQREIFTQRCRGRPGRSRTSARRQHSIHDREWIACTWPLLEYARNYSEVTAVSYERLALDPVSEFPELCEVLDIDYPGAVEHRVIETSTGKMIDPKSSTTHILVRDSRRTALSWQDRLTDEEIDRVLTATAHVRKELDRGRIRDRRRLSPKRSCAQRGVGVWGLQTLEAWREFATVGAFRLAPGWTATGPTVAGTAVDVLHMAAWAVRAASSRKVGCELSTGECRTGGMVTSIAMESVDALEAEAIHIFREVPAVFDRPALMFSGSKESCVMLHLAAKRDRATRDPIPGVAHRHR